MFEKDYEKRALDKYKKGVRFKSPFFGDEIYESAGDIAGIGIKDCDEPFVNIWVQNRGMPQPNVPVFLNGEWGEILE